MKLLLLYISRTGLTAARTWVFLVSFAFRRAARPRILRRYLERCGAGFVKLGQVLAMRHDFLPAEYCQELMGLLDQLPSSPAAEIVATIEAELGRPIGELFAEFDAAPLSSASVAQVHAAVLHSGEQVVVKVKHPGIDARYRIDLLNLRIMAWLGSLLGIFRGIDAGAVARELERIILEELDFRHEARNIYVLHELLKSDQVDHYGPALHRQFCGASVITMERLRGVWMREILTASDQGDEERLRQWSAQGITRARTARLLLRSTLEQCFSHRIFHADPHAGNLILMEGGTLGYVDFGTIGWLDEKLWSEQFAMNQAIATGQIHRAYESILDTLEPLPDTDLSGFEMEVKTLLMDWLFATKVPGTPIQERSSAGLFLRLFDLLRRQGLNMSLPSLRLCRALMISDIISLRLDPNLDRLKELQDYFDDQARRDFEHVLAQQLSWNAVCATTAGIARMMQTVPDAVAFLRKRLPPFGRQYEKAVGGFERASLMALGNLRTLAVLVALAIAGGRLFALRVWPGSWWARATGSLGDSWWLAAGASALIALMLARMIRKFR